MTTPFSFLASEWPDVYEAATQAAASAYPDPRTACFYARRAVERAVHWIYKYDGALCLPYSDNLSALIHEPTFKAAAGDVVFTKARLIIKLGNNAVHGAGQIQPDEAVTAVRELFHVAYWLARTYARGAKPAPGLTFSADALPKSAPLPRHTLEQVQQLARLLNDRDEKLKQSLADKDALNAELHQARAEIEAIRAANAAQPDTHDYNEAETRDKFIDLLLREAGWTLSSARDREFEVSGMPNNQGKGFVDYVLWGDDGKPLGLVEAKRTRVDPRAGLQQAKLYADCLEKQFGQRPVIFYTNGYEHWIWDDTHYPPRQLQGFYKKAELELLIQRRASRKSLAEAEINQRIVERYYQTRAVRRIGEAFEKDKERKALIVMATGAGKTRTVIALCDLLMRCNWAKRVLFLADRVALVNQAVGAFKKHLPDAAPVNLVTERLAEGRVFVSTYPTMMGLIDESNDGQRRFSSGHFDLIIIDEAHRSVFQKYRTIFDYFDALLVGLTATPKDEIDRNTYSLFDLDDGVPTDAYPLSDAVRDGFLVPVEPISVPLKFQREGITYEQLSEDEKEQWDALEWDDEDGAPERVEAEAVNKWLFNKDTVDKVLAHLMTRGQTVAGGDRLGKTIIFAKNKEHANFIAERFDVNYPQFRGHFARSITYKTTYAQSLIDDFSIKDKAPHIAISVDMLDTGIDVPEVVNLVFFKLVRSKTKFWQMIGRGTRLCEDLFGPGQHKKSFYLFDFCQNLEFFSQDPPRSEGSTVEPLSARLFKTRLELLGELDKQGANDLKDDKPVYGHPTNERALRRTLADQLHAEVAAMNVDNFIVRPKRRLVERYANADQWAALTPEQLSELGRDVAGLPAELQPEAEEAKRFDLLALHLQLAVLRSEPSFTQLRDRVKAIAGLLEEKSAIPAVRSQMALIQEIQSDEWWQDVTAPMLESLRRNLRDLVAFIEKRQRTPIYTDFVDEMGAEQRIVLPGFAVPGNDLDKFRAKARNFLRAQHDHPAVRKLRLNEPLTRHDIDALERLMVDGGIGGADELQRAKEAMVGLGLFARSLVGLDREAAKAALGKFAAAKPLTASQIEFVNMIVEHLVEHGYLDTGRLYTSPFTDVSPSGPEGLFTAAQVDALDVALREVRERAK